jgi:hypothetical protein
VHVEPERTRSELLALGLLVGLALSPFTATSLAYFLCTTTTPSSSANTASPGATLIPAHTTGLLSAPGMQHEDFYHWRFLCAGKKRGKVDGGQGGDEAIARSAAPTNVTNGLRFFRGRRHLLAFRF